MTARTPQTGANRRGVGQSQPASEGRILFAQPLYASKFPDATKNSDRNAAGGTRGIVWTLAVVICGALLSIARPDGAQNLPATQNARTTPAPANGRTPTPGRSANIVPAQTTQQLLDAPEESRRSVDFYTQTVRGNLFNAPQAPTPKPVIIAAPKVEKPAPAPFVPPVVIDPFASWSYTGTVTMGDQTIALLENTQTKDGQYVKAGDNFMGAQVVSVTDQMVTLKSGKKPTMLAKSDNITVTPLDRSAAPVSTSQQNPAQQAPQGQAAQGAQFSVPQGQAQPMITLPNGRQMSQDRYQRFQQRLNNNFNR